MIRKTVFNGQVVTVTCIKKKIGDRKISQTTLTVQTEFTGEMQSNFDSGKDIASLLRNSRGSIGSAELCVFADAMLEAHDGDGVTSGRFAQSVKIKTGKVVYADEDNLPSIRLSIVFQTCAESHYYIDRIDETLVFTIHPKQLELFEKNQIKELEDKLKKQDESLQKPWSENDDKN